MILARIALNLARLKLARKRRQFVHWMVNSRSHLARTVLLAAVVISVLIAPWIASDKRST